ncbi:MAG: HAMP domain-containing protein [Deltaproteobacteria bacterium]|nr:HAMP domain-containing protein [Deltaproteobacteria bacterium]
MGNSLSMRALVLIVVLASAGLGWAELQVRSKVDAEAQALESIASELAALVDADAHERIVGSDDATGADFLRLRRSLRAAAERRDLTSPVYTLRKVSESEVEFVVMTNPTPYIGDRYPLRDAMRPVLEAGERGRTGIYGDDHGRWVSAYAPVKAADGTVVALVEVDQPANALRSELARLRLQALLAAVVLALILAVLPEVARSDAGFVMAVRRLFAGRLAVRIGLAGSLAVVLAVGIVGVLDHRAAEAELVDHLTQQLTTAVRVGAVQLDPAMHAELARTGDPKTSAFYTLREQLRGIKEGAGLSSPVYTLRKDGQASRFVAMTNETPFIGDLQELRAGVAQTFVTGEPGSEGPYTNATDTWISAWAPIIDRDGAVIAVVQADHPVGTLLGELDNRSLRRLLFALAGVGLAFLFAGALARGIARPIGAIAEAAARIGEGHLDVRVDVERLDEVGDLGRAVNDMARGLAEREQLRTMFGKYMASQVVQELLDKGELSLEGEAREITVLLSDIRGYTALTETLGAAEIVSLLNEYFGMLVDSVMEEEGVVDKFMGDAMLCWFGAPVTTEDHGASAVRAALRMEERLAEWNARRVADGKVAVATGIGIALGKVVVGNIGSQQRLEYTAIGDAVNLASRLCSKAEAGEVLLCSRTFEAALEGGVDADCFVDVGAVDMKGVSEPVMVHRLKAGPGLSGVA